MQGCVVNKPHGYAGDYEIIDKIQTNWVCQEKHLKKWDKFFQWQMASTAVRNRKEFFKKLLTGIERSALVDSTVLNVGCGPCRDIHEYLSSTPSSRIELTCLDMDQKAIEYSKSLLNGYHLSFICKNAFKYRTSKKYDIAWSAGLFDYLDDKQFIFLLRSLLSLVKPQAKVIIGNFSKNIPSRHYIEFGEWFLYHRCEKDLEALAISAGVDPQNITVNQERSGVNLFLKWSKLQVKSK